LSESVLLRKILLHASKLGITLFRNSVGRYRSPNGHWMSFGLCVGSSDLIGWKSITVTPDMIGRRIAVFTAVETKAPHNDTTNLQARFIKAVHDAGGFATVARNVEDLARLSQ
jgi:hypothetical protein